MKLRRRIRFLGGPFPWVVLVPLVLASGCARRGELSGNVSFQGKAVRMGSVGVVGEDGIPRSTQILENGSYVIGDIPTGAVRLTVTSPDPKNIRIIPPKHGPAPPPPDSSNWFAIPEQYAAFDQSGLTFTLKSGKNRFDIDLK